MLRSLLSCMLLLAFVAVACSSELTSELNGRPCDANGLCLTGYKCDATRHCVRDEEPDPARCNYGMNFWGTTPVGSFHAGASLYGCLDMTGNVWEWTSTPFDAFPGFEPFPYPEYSQTWFDGDHRVLKGGSWATRSPLLRTSFRNFFRRHFRIAFAGLRCAIDA